MTERAGFPKDLYDFWNSRYFRGRLPDIPVYWSKAQFKTKRSRSRLGFAQFRHDNGKPVRIVLNPWTRSHRSIWQSTLLHEMVHVKQWKVPYSQAHGNKFNKEMKRLAVAGAFRYIW